MATGAPTAPFAQAKVAYSTCHITAGGVVVPLGAVIAVKDAASKSRSCAIVNRAFHNPLHYLSGERSTVLFYCRTYDAPSGQVMRLYDAPSGQVTVSA
jgi:hypothetical protein